MHVTAFSRRPRNQSKDVDPGVIQGCSGAHGQDAQSLTDNPARQSRSDMTRRGGVFKAPIPSHPKEHREPPAAHVQVQSGSSSPVFMRTYFTFDLAFSSPLQTGTSSMLLLVVEIVNLGEPDTNFNNAEFVFAVYMGPKTTQKKKRGEDKGLRCGSI